MVVAVEMLRVELPPEVTEVGESVAVTPEGAPLTVRLTVCALPEVVAVEMVSWSEPPATTERLAGLAEMEKLFPATALETMQLLAAFEYSVCTV